MLHLVGLGVGIGAAMLLDLSFGRFLLSLDKQHWRPEWYRLCSRLVWSALIVITLSGAGLFLTDVDRFLHSSRFLTKMVVVGVIAANGFLLHRYVFPRLNELFAQTSLHSEEAMGSLRRRAFIAGSVSLTSWYSALGLGLYKSFAPPLVIGLLSHVSLLLLGALASLVIAHLFGRNLAHKSNEVARGVAAELLSDLDVHQTLLSRPRR